MRRNVLAVLLFLLCFLVCQAVGLLLFFLVMRGVTKLSTLRMAGCVWELVMLFVSLKLSGWVRARFLGGRRDDM